MPGWSARRLPYLVSGLFIACTTYSASDVGSGTSMIDPDGSAAGGTSGAASGGKASAGGGAGSGTTASGATTANGGTANGGSSNAGGSDNQAGGGDAPVGGEGGTASSGAPAGGAGGQGPFKPIGLKLADTTTDEVRELNATNNPFSERCPAGQVVVGFNGTVDDPTATGAMTYLRSAQAVCGKLAVSASEPYTVTVTPAAPLPMHEVAAAKAQAVMCPANQVMTGFAGRSGLWMDSADVRCAPLSILGASPKFLLVVGTPATAGTIGGATGGSVFDPIECPAGALAVGQIIRTMYSGQVLAAFGIECAMATLTTGPG